MPPNHHISQPMDSISHISKQFLHFLRKLKVLDYFMEDPLAIFTVFEKTEGFRLLSGEPFNISFSFFRIMRDMDYLL